MGSSAIGGAGLRQWMHRMRILGALPLLIVIGAACAGGGTEGASGTTTAGSATTASPSKVVFHLTGKIPRKDVFPGPGGSGKFTLSGAGGDSGTFVDYRSAGREGIRIRRTLTGKNGKLTMVVETVTF